jgi:hypothetical protein
MCQAYYESFNFSSILQDKSEFGVTYSLLAAAENTLSGHVPSED